MQREIVKTEQKLKGLEKQSKDTTSTMNKIADSASKIGEKATSIGESMLPVTGAIAGVGTAALVMSNNFDDAMADVNTLLDDESHLKNYAEKIRKVSDKLNINLVGATQGMYQAISSLGDGEETDEIFFTMAKSAKAGGAETAEAVSLISAAMKGYGSINDETAKKISDLSFTTAKLGVTTFPEMAKSMQPLFPLANSLGFSMEELYGVMATGTGVTGNTAEVSTQFKAILSNLMKPTKEMTTLIESYGYSNAQAMIENEGLAGTLKILKDETGGQSDKLAKLFSSTEAITLVSALAGEQMDTFNEKLLAMGDASGATDTAFQKKQTQAEKFRASINKIKNSAVDLGVALSPVFEKVSQVIGKIANKLKKLTPKQMKTIALVGGLIASIAPLLIIIGKLSMGVGGLIKVVQFLAPIFTTVAGAINLPILAITALVGAIIYLWNTNENFRNFIIECCEFICAVVEARVNDIINFFTVILPTIFMNFLNWLNTFFITDWTTKFGLLGLIINGFRDNIKAIFTAVLSIFQNLISFIKNIFTGNWSAAWKNVVDIFGNIFNLIKDLALAPINFVMGLIDGVVESVKNAIEWLTKLGKKKDESDDDEDDNRRSRRRNKKTRMMAKGGILSHGEAIVAEAGPELIQMMNGRAVVTPLTKTSTNTEVQTTTSKGSESGNVTVHIHSPKALTAAESARYFKRAQRELALGVR